MGALTDSQSSHLEELLGPQGFRTDPVTLAGCATDWTGRFTGHPPAVLLPSSVDEVRAAVAYCNEQHLAVVAQGGNTGLVGGSVPLADELVLSLRRLNRIRAFDATDGTLICDSGCIVQDLEEHTLQAGWRLPIDFGARGSALIGGALATRVGGFRFVRDGPIAAHVRGLEVVLADGTLLAGLSTLAKNNTGYAWPQLFLGSEGTLGVITGVSLALRPVDRASETALCAIDGFACLPAAVRLARQQLGPLLAAAEFFDASAAARVLSALPEAVMPIGEAPLYFLVEVHGMSPEATHAAMLSFLEACAETSWFHDGTLAGSPDEARRLWRLRDSVPVSLQRFGVPHKYDVAVPVVAYPTFVDGLKSALAAECLPLDLVLFGHAAEGNLHVNLLGSVDGVDWLTVDRLVYGQVAAVGGSISAEHGMGVLKRDFLNLSRTDAEIKLMYELRDLLDPHGILNPGKVLPNRKR